MRVLFVGSKDLGVEILRRMICVNRSELVGAITIDDRHDSRSAYDKFFEVCDQNGVPLTIAGARADSERAMLESHPDLCIVAGWYWLIGSPVLRSLKHGFIGLHFSLLPKYRGSSPLVWTLINGDVEAGFTFFSMTEAMDEGPVWAQGSVEGGPMDYVSDVIGRLQTESTKVFSNIYPKILRGEMLPTPQIGDPTYCASRVPRDARLSP